MVPVEPLSATGSESRTSAVPVNGFDLQFAAMAIDNMFNDGEP